MKKGSLPSSFKWRQLAATQNTFTVHSGKNHGFSGREKLQEPGQHKMHETLSFEAGQMLVLIFQRLTEKRRLNRCRHKGTQNPNESLHNIVWRFFPKINYGTKIQLNVQHVWLCASFQRGALLKSFSMKCLKASLLFCFLGQKHPQPFKYLS